MNKQTEYFISRKELIDLCRKHFGINFKEECKLSSIGVKFYE